MRITNNMMIGNLLRNLDKNRQLMERSNRALSSGKKFSFPGEDPIGTGKSMGFNSGLIRNDQYRSNIEDGLTWLENTDSALSDASEVLLRARELSIYGANETHDQISREGIAAEIDGLRDHLLQVGNSSYAGRYIFSGEKTSTKPFDQDGSYQGDSNSFMFEIAPGNYMEINLPGSEVFGDSSVTAEDDSVISILDKIADNLRQRPTIDLESLNIDEETGVTAIDAEGLKEGDYQLAIESLTGEVDAEATEVDSLLSGSRETFFGGLINAGSDNDSPYSGSLEMTVLEDGIDVDDNSLQVLVRGHLYDGDGNYHWLEGEYELDLGADEDADILNIDASDFGGPEDLNIAAGEDLGGIAEGEFEAGDMVHLSLSGAVADGEDYTRVRLSSGQLEHNFHFTQGFMDQDQFDLNFFNLDDNLTHDGTISLTMEEPGDGEISFDYRVQELGGNNLERLDEMLNRVLTYRSTMGGRVNRLDLNKNRLEDNKLRLETVLSKTEDADIAEEIMELKMQETVQRAALASGARIIQPSLVDFLQ